MEYDYIKYATNKRLSEMLLDYKAWISGEKPYNKDNTIPPYSLKERITLFETIASRLRIEKQFDFNDEQFNI